MKAAYNELALRHVAPNNITETHAQILTLSAQGLDAEAIAVQRGTTYRGVHSHFNKASLRLNSSSATESVLRARRYGLIEVPELTKEEEDKIALLTPSELCTVRNATQFDGQYSNANLIAKVRGISVNTVRRRMQCVLEKLGPVTYNGEHIRDNATSVRAAVMVTLFDSNRAT